MNTPETVMKTPYKIDKEATDLAIYNDYHELIKVPGTMKGAVVKYLLQKYNFHAPTTIWFARKRVEKRLETEKIIL